MVKRGRGGEDQEVFEPFTALLRQSTSRAVDRLRLHRNLVNGGRDGYVQPGGQQPQRTAAGGTGAAASVKPIDLLVIQYCMYFLDSSKIPPTHFVRLAQEVLTACPDRVLQPTYFAKAPSLPMMCESLVSENTAEVMQATLKDVEEFIEVRESLGEWIAERTAGNAAGSSSSDDDDEEEYGRGRRVKREEGFDEWQDGNQPYYDHEEDEEDGYDGGGYGRRRRRGGGYRGGRGRGIGDDEDEVDPEQAESTLNLAGMVYTSLEFWLRVRAFINSLSLGSAKMDLFPLRPKYEQELLLLLHSLASSHAKAANTRGAGRAQGEETASDPRGPVLPSPSPPSLPAPPLAAPTSTSTTTTTTTTRSVVKKEEPHSEEDEGTPQLPPHLTPTGSLKGGPLHTVSSALATADLNDPALAAAAAAMDDEESEEEEDDDAYYYDGAVTGTERAASSTAATAQRSGRSDAATLSAQEQRRAIATAVLADTLALANCPTASATGSAQKGAAPEAAGSTAVVVVPPETRERLKGVQPAFFTMVHARLSVMVARDRLRQFGRAMAVSPPPLTVAQRNALDEELARRAQQAATQAGMMLSGPGGEALGLPVEFVPDDAYYARMLQQSDDVVGEDEELYKDEVVDYYLRQRMRAAASAGAAANSAARRSRAKADAEAGEPELVKPHRFCKVKTGFTWSQYNRTHYDSRTNPPPRTVMWYEFTLFYPALVNTKRDMRNIFHIEDTPRGPNDDYCLLVFSPGPPYADVAYRIVKKQWDPRRGGVRISFDATGKYKLFFRFTNSNYRR